MKWTTSNAMLVDRDHGIVPGDEGEVLGAVVVHPITNGVMKTRTNCPYTAQMYRTGQNETENRENKKTVIT